MDAPVLSTFILLAEIVVSACVYGLIWYAYTRGTFFRWFAYGVLAYEILFNISYMLAHFWGRVEPSSAELPPLAVGLAIFHGTFSIIMFLALIAFFLFASRGYARGDNFFRTHRSLTITFAVAWGIAVLSGVVFYFVLYV
ncbi:MAG TPA: hypothetical protein VMH91_03855 [Candidatus Paceibacterota bacterium]|nr:hypothetical protein [Candidatus Paceibacterota bacterium]